MAIDESGWHDLNQRLAALQLDQSECEILVEHLVDRLVGHFGTAVIECHLGKDDPARHSMREVAAASIAHLAPVLGELPSSTVTELVAAGTLGARQPPPWDDHWRTLSRTASWRS